MEFEIKKHEHYIFLFNESFDATYSLARSPISPSSGESGCPANFHKNPRVLQRLYLIHSKVVPSCSQDTAATRVMGPSSPWPFLIWEYGERAFNMGSKLGGCFPEPNALRLELAGSHIFPRATCEGFSFSRSSTGPETSFPPFPAGDPTNRKTYKNLRFS